jgi:hypothetical protein
MQIPTALSIKNRFPVFASVPDNVVEFSIEEASLVVDGSWGTATEQLLAISYVVAHFLMIAIQRMESGSGQIVSSERIGEMSISYLAQVVPTMKDPSDWAMTAFGLRYLAILRRNVPAIAVV